MHCLKLAFHIIPDEVATFHSYRQMPLELQLIDNPVHCSIDQIMCEYLSEHVYNFCIYVSLPPLKEQSVIVYFQCPMFQL